jgi:hypothetical protein
MWHTCCGTGPQFILYVLFDRRFRSPRPTAGFEPATKELSDPYVAAINAAQYVLRFLKEKQTHTVIVHAGIYSLTNSTIQKNAVCGISVI